VVNIPQREAQQEPQEQKVGFWGELLPVVEVLLQQTMLEMIPGEPEGERTVVTQAAPLWKRTVLSLAVPLEPPRSRQRPPIELQCSPAFEVLRSVDLLLSLPKKPEPLLEFRFLWIPSTLAEPAVHVPRVDGCGKEVPCLLELVVPVEQAPSQASPAASSAVEAAHPPSRDQPGAQKPRKHTG